MSAKRLLLLGGGHAHALVLRQWARGGARPDADITLVNPGSTAQYSGMLPGVIAGHYALDELTMDLACLCKRVGATFMQGRADAVEADSRRVHVEGQGWQDYDLLSVDIGITTQMPELEGAAEHAHVAKPLGPLAAAWAGFVERAGRGEVNPHVAVIGGGVAGVELVLAMAHRLEQERSATITLIEVGDWIARELPVTARRALERTLSKTDVAVLTGKRVQRVEAMSLTFDDGDTVPSAFTVLAAGAQPHSWLQESGLALEAGYIAVDDMLRSTSHPNVFAAGDCAHLTHAPRPKAGVFAVRAAPVLAHNLATALSGGSMLRFGPQSDYLKLISLGRKSAVATKWGLSASGPWAWSLKDRIDRAFMAGFDASSASRNH